MQEFLSLFNVALLSATLRVSTSLILAGLGYVICAQAGVVDMGLEGKLLCGAFLSVFVTGITGSHLLGVLAAMIGTALYSYIIGLVMVRLYANHTIVGIGSNFIVQGITAVLLVIVWDNAGTSDNYGKLGHALTDWFAKIPGIGGLFTRQTTIMPIAYLLVFIITIWLFKTKTGLRLRAIGENPAAADSLGLNVYRYQMLACAFSGLLCGLGGADLAIGQLGYFAKEMTSGRGYMALACAVVGRFNPKGMVIACIIVAFVDAMQVRLQTLYSISPEFFQIIPYLVPVVVISCFGGIKAPSGTGKPFRRGER